MKKYKLQYCWYWQYYDKCEILISNIPLRIFFSWWRLSLEEYLMQSLGAELPLLTTAEPPWRLLRPILSSQYKRDMDHTKKNPRKCHRGGASQLWRKVERHGTVHPREEKAQWAFINVYGYLKGGSKRGRARPFSVVPNGRSRYSGYKMKHRRFALNTREHFFSCDGWLARLPFGSCAVVQSPCLELLRGHLDRGLGNLQRCLPIWSLLLFCETVFVKFF